MISKVTSKSVEPTNLENIGTGNLTNINNEQRVGTVDDIKSRPRSQTSSRDTHEDESTESAHDKQKESEQPYAPSSLKRKREDPHKSGDIEVKKCHVKLAESDS